MSRRLKPSDEVERHKALEHALRTILQPGSGAQFSTPSLCGALYEKQRSWCNGFAVALNHLGITELSGTAGPRKVWRVTNAEALLRLLEDPAPLYRAITAARKGLYPTPDTWGTYEAPPPAEGELPPDPPEESEADVLVRVLTHMSNKVDAMAATIEEMKTKVDVLYRELHGEKS